MPSLLQWDTVLIYNQDIYIPLCNWKLDLKICMHLRNLFFFLYIHPLQKLLKPLMNTRIFEVMVLVSQRMDP